MLEFKRLQRSTRKPCFKTKVTLSPILMEVENYPKSKETNNWRDPFSTSMIMGGRVFVLIFVEIWRLVNRMIAVYRI